MLRYYTNNSTSTIQWVRQYYQYGDSGNNVIYGKDYELSYFIGSGGYADVLYGYGGADKLFGGAGNDYLSGGTEGDSLWGGEGADVLDGGSGFDWAQYDQATSGVGASLSRPSMNRGEAAGDTYIGIEGLVGSAFGDFLEGDFRDNQLRGGGGRDSLYGQDGEDILDGGDEGDWLFGHEANDTINGGDGDDFIVGGAGVDNLSGGADADTFRFNPGDTGFSAASGMDVITDFNPFEGDKIDLRGMVDRGPFYQSLDGFVFIGDFTPANIWDAQFNNPGMGHVGFTQLGPQDFTIHINTFLDDIPDYSISVHTGSSATLPDLSWFILS